MEKIRLKANMNTALGQEHIFVYLLRCSDGSIYIGTTENLQTCLASHFNKEVEETRDKLPVEIYSYVAFSDKCKARAFQKFLNSRAGRLFIQNRWV